MAKTSKEETGFLMGIRADPEHDGPLLIYADWLEERGETQRAEFLRASVAIWRNEDLDERARERAQWELANRRPNALYWGAVPLPGLDGVRWWRLERGTVRRAGFASGKTFERHGDRVMRCSVVDDVELGHLWANVESRELRELRAWEGVRRLRLHSAGSGRGPFLELLESPRLAGLVEMELSGLSLETEGTRGLTESPHAGHWRALDLRHNRIGPEGAQALARSPRLVALRRLDLGFNSIGSEGALALANSPHFPVLEEIKVGGVPSNSPGARALRSRFRSVGFV